MSELIETLWQQFALEASERFEAMDRILSQATQAPPSADDIAALFRAFHSLKGAARAMDLFGMEKLGHAAETVLGRIRSGTLPFSEPVAEALLEGLDALRGMMEVAVAERRDSPAPETLLARLDHAGEAPPSAGPPKKGRGKAKAKAPAASTPASSPSPLHGNEKLLNLFVGHLREGMATLTRALFPDALDDEGLAEVIDTAESLEIGCERLSFLPFADTFRRFREVAKARQADAILKELQEIARISARLSKLSGKDAGAAILSTLLVDHNAQALKSGVSEVQRLLATSDAEGAAVAGAYDKLAATAEVIGTPRAATLLRQTGDLFRRGLPPASDRCTRLLSHCRQAVDLIAQQAAHDPPEDIAAAVAAEQGAALRTLAETAGDDPHRPFTVGELAGYGIDTGLLRFLSPESAALLRGALARRDTGLYEITAYVEESPQLASGFATWLNTRVQAITNWPEFIEGKTWLKVLVASADGEATLRAGLAEMDPDGEYLLLCACGSTPEPAVTPPPAPPAPITGPTEVAAVRPPEPPASPEAETLPTTLTRAPSGGGVLRVPGEAIDRFMARIDGMVLLSSDLNGLAHDTRLEDAMDALVGRLGSTDPDLRVLLERMERHRRDLMELDAELSRSVDRLRESALDLRVVPIETLFNQFPRVVREMARVQGKRIRLSIEGGDVRIDKSMVEMLYDPLLHMVRNAIDHGIESPERRQAAGKPAQAELTIRAAQRSNRVNVEIADDGRGIPTEAVRAKAVAHGLLGEAESHRMSPSEIHELIFHPGFSTAERITETSGRGVGMDIVRANITKLGGAVAIRTRSGQGSTFVVELPLSAAILRALLVQLNDQVLAIPDRSVEEVCGFRISDFRVVSGCWTVLRRGRLLPVVHLSDALGFPSPDAEPPADRERLIVVLRRDDRRIGVEIDRLLRRGDLFVRESHPGLVAVPGVGGVSLLNDGRVVVILDGDDLFRLACAAQRPVAEPINLPVCS
ncbi:MAG TPA: ATP-binding protein [Azospirillaceae bacterium]|nr:ATP-binding protein [Azospirillaceae bacterium]